MKKIQISPACRRGRDFRFQIITVLFLFFVFCFLLLAACVHSPKNKSEDIMRVPAGSNVPSVGIAFDASYDPMTDGIVPGYKILSVAVVNNSIDIVQLDQNTDKWLVVDLKGGKHKAIISLKDENPKLFTSLPEKLRSKIEYPMLVQVGETKIVDLLFKNSVKLDSFRAVRFSSRIIQKSFEIVSQD